MGLELSGMNAMLAPPEFQDFVGANTDQMATKNTMVNHKA